MISGLQKMTLLDYPGKVACTVFLQGCNYRCPFCHNSDLLPRQGQPLMEPEQLLTFLQKRRGLLDGVCVSGGEPTLQPELPQLLEAIKAMGYAVKLDTNGSHPEILMDLARRKLVDYVAMDVKNCPDRYAETVGLGKVDLGSIEESLRFLMSGAVACELRTTVVEQLHNEASMEELGRWLASLGAPPALYLQKFVDRESVLFSGFSAPDPEKLAHYVEILKPYVPQAQLRGE